MACLTRKPRSPYWMAKFRAADNRIVMRSTKQRDLRLARRVADEWEDASRKARAGELTRDATTRILNELMEKTGERILTPSVREYFAEWLSRRQIHGRAASTSKRYQAVFDSFFALIGEARAAARLIGITPLDIERFKDAELQAGKSASTADFAVKVLHAVFGDAVRKGIITANPAAGVEKSSGMSEERQPFTDEQIIALLRAADAEWRGMILFGAHAGLRLADAASLTWLNLDLAGQKLSFRAQKTASRKKGREKDTEVKLHRELLEHLESLPAGDKPDAPLFPLLHGKKPGSAGGLSNAFARLMARAGISVPLGEAKTGKGRRFRALGFHSLRHSFITRLLNADVLPDVRKKLAGHSSDKVHERYGRLDLSTQERALQKLPRLLPASSGK